MAPTQNSTEAFRKATANPRRLSARGRRASFAPPQQPVQGDPEPGHAVLDLPPLTEQAADRHRQRQVDDLLRLEAEPEAQDQGNHAKAAGHHVAVPVGDGMPQQQADQGADDQRAGH